ncbi:MAG: choice-of-anchor tandem repeat GloVer-containing protein [Bryobacteraceae bacterium]
MLSQAKNEITSRTRRAAYLTPSTRNNTRSNTSVVDIRPRRRTRLLASVFLPALALGSAMAAWSQPAGSQPGQRVPPNLMPVPAPQQAQPDRLPAHLKNRLRLRQPATVQTDTAQKPASAETVLYNFENQAPKGSLSEGGVIRDEDGNLYGATLLGGVGFGVVYKLDPAGRQTVLYSFTGGADGNAPVGNLARDFAGNLYGTTEAGGTGSGVVYKLDPAGKLTVLHSFANGADGDNPFAGLVLDPAGNLYGTTLLGGSAGAGVAFKVDRAGNETVLHTFTGGADGGYPSGSLMLDAAGNLYGTVGNGGNMSACGGFGCGVVFKLDTSGNETVLYNFTGGADGAYPQGEVMRDWAGNLYSTTYGGGNLSACNGNGCGVVFKLDKSGNETALHAFTGADGAYPFVGVVSDELGNLYGTTQNGGDLSACLSQGCGVVFKLDRSGNETVLHTFTGGTDGAQSYGGVIRDWAGNLYGTTVEGGSANFGVVYTLDRTGKETTLHSFPGAAGGSTPFAGVTRDEVGDLFGTTFAGGTANMGVVYQLNPFGHESALYAFTGGADGGLPDAGVIRDSAGNLYGTTSGGGNASACPAPPPNLAGCGVVFKLDPSGSQTVLHSFTGADGSSPIGSLARDLTGNLYGATAGGGNLSQCNGVGCGVIFKLDPTGNETVLHTFMGGADGSQSYGSPILDSVGNIYGTVSLGGAGTCYGSGCGYVFKLDKSGNLTVLYSFTGGADGGFPRAGVIRDSAGNLYGTTSGGGDLGSSACFGGCGVVFKLDPSGNETVLYTFTGGADGSQPFIGSLVRDSAGNLYGTTYYGGYVSPSACFGQGCGVVFKVDTSGNETVLYTFSGGADGGQPDAGVIFDPEGNIYGTTARAGKDQGGTVFKLPSH